MAHATDTLKRSGTFVWEELITSDVMAARGFYGTVLGWSSTSHPIGDGKSYTMFAAGEHTVAGGFETTDIPPAWGTYVGVDSADAAAARARELGAEVLREPFDVMEFGRMATFKDPAGAAINVWQAKGDEGTPPPAVHGAVAWHETRSRNLEASLSFYRELFGWTAEPHEMGTFTYWILSRDDQQVGGAMQISAEMGDMPSHWAITFQVDDADAAFAAATANGATVLMEPEDIPGVGRYAGLLDPQGAAFGIMTPAE